MATQIDVAEAQLLGFTHGRAGFTLISLIESMGLTKGEWKKLKDQFDLHHLSEDDFIEIEEYFQTKKS